MSEPQEQEQGHARVREAAAARGLDIEIVARPEARSLHEAAEILGLDDSDIVKTLVVKRSDGTYLFALVPGCRSISWPKLRAVVGVNKLRMPDPELALEATGYERGTITPIGSTTDWPVFADASIVGRPRLQPLHRRGYAHRGIWRDGSRYLEPGGLIRPQAPSSSRPSTSSVQIVSPTRNLRLPLTTRPDLR